MRIKKYHLFVILFSLFALQNIGQNNRSGYNEVLHQPPEVDFSWNQVCLGDTTYFTNGTIRGMSYEWYIYDKNMNVLDSSSNLNISYLFPTADTFFVFLQADNGHLASSSQMVIIDTSLTSNFSFMHCSNQFMNHSTCANSYFWDFGDGSTSTLQSPNHQYADTGRYTVKFIAYKGTQSDTTIKQIFVDPIAFPTGAITYYLSGDTLFVHAVDSSAGIFYNWKFGDFTPNIYVRDTFHVYANPGTYILNFGDWNTCNTAYSVDTIVINPVNSVHSVSVLNSVANIFPNPIKRGALLQASMNFSLKDSDRFTIFNSLGENILEGKPSFNKGSTKFSIDSSTLSEGLYVLVIDDGKYKSLSKFIVFDE